MKSKNKVLLIALMLVTSIFFSSCIIVHDWDDDYVYTAECSTRDFQREYFTFNDYNLIESYPDYKYKFNDTNFYYHVKKSYMSKSEVRGFIKNYINISKDTLEKKFNTTLSEESYNNNINNIIDDLVSKFYSHEHVVFDFRDGKTVYSISK